MTILSWLAWVAFFTIGAVALFTLIWVRHDRRLDLRDRWHRAAYRRQKDQEDDTDG